MKKALGETMKEEKEKKAHQKITKNNYKGWWGVGVNAYGQQDRIISGVFFYAFPLIDHW